MCSSDLMARIGRRERGIDYWPGFVDALSTLVLAIVFLLTVFMVAQFFLSQQVTDKDTALQKLTRQISELTDLLALERVNRKNLEDNLALLGDTLNASETERKRLEGLLAGSGGVVPAPDANGQMASLNRDLDAQRQISARALAQVEAQIGRAHV